MKNKIILLMMLLGAIAFSGCPDEEPIKPDPCAGVVETSADFTMKEIIDTIRIETDTIYTGNTVEFSAKYDADEYEWKLGTDDRTWKTKKFTLNFLNFMGNVDVRLIAKRKAINKECTPNDDGIDTIMKRLSVVHNSLVFGNFRGVSTQNLKDTFTISIKEFADNVSDNRWVLIYNLNKGCVDTSQDATSSYIMRIIGYKAFYFISSFDGYKTRPLCFNPVGLAKSEFGGNGITIDYSLIEDTIQFSKKPRTYYTFKGVRQ